MIFQGNTDTIFFLFLALLILKYILRDNIGLNWLTAGLTFMLFNQVSDLILSNSKILPGFYTEYATIGAISIGSVLFGIGIVITIYNLFK
jgi:hypothetical protein